MILINSPNNPTGAVYPKEVLARIAELAIQHDLLVISDEIYEKIIYQKDEHFSIASIPGMEKRTITVNGFSKAYAMTGWRLGYVVSDKELMIPMVKVQQYSVTCIPTFTQFGASEALTSDQQSLHEMVHAYEKRRDIVYKGLLSIDGITCTLPMGAFYAFPNISQFGLTSREFASKILNEAGVAMVPGSVFSDVGERHVRLSYAASEKALIDAIDRIRLCVNNLVL
jgi:aminotransferase